MTPPQKPPHRPPRESYQARAERLARATEGLCPSGGFELRVLAALGPDPAGWWGFVTPIAKPLVPVLLLLALLTSALAVRAAARTDTALAVAYGSVEVEW